MVLNRNLEISERFGEKAHIYDKNALPQAQIASHLSKCLPKIKNPKVLEIGCGTGLLTEQLVRLYPDGEIIATDLSKKMIDACKAKIGHNTQITFACCDGETIHLNDALVFANFDLIVTSMTIQWFEDPVSALERLKTLLKKTGTLFYATLGPKNFPEWRELLAQSGIDEGTLDIPKLPGLFAEEFIQLSYSSKYDFLKSLKRIGAAMPREGYTPVSTATLRKLLNSNCESQQEYFTWHIVYGQLTS